ncbi:MAG: type II toxin-antitoxin system VapC family toxin [Nitrososphaerota archaeon]
MKIEYNEAVLDASLFIQAFVREDYTDLAIELINNLKKIYAPLLLIYEIGNALIRLARRKFIENNEVIEKLNLAYSTPNLELRKHNIENTAKIALNLNISFYDASYIELSRELNVPLITADKFLYEKGKNTDFILYAPEL